jgi:hypothetical protein
MFHSPLLCVIADSLLAAAFGQPPFCYVGLTCTHVLNHAARQGFGTEFWPPRCSTTSSWLNGTLAGMEHEEQIVLIEFGGRELQNLDVGF